MIVFYLGIPGSGKSYAGVYTIYNNFTDNKDAKKDLKKNYKRAYTNINEFQFQKCQNVYKFDADYWNESIRELHELYKKKATDEELLELAEEKKISHCLIVLDECHNFFDVEKKHLVWWLTYHRHLYQDIYLITQNLALVHSKYKPLAEAYYKARPSSLTFNKKVFSYSYYTDSRLTQAGKVGIVKYPKKKEVFALYHSGDSVDSKNVVFKFIFISAFFLILLIIGIYFYSSSHEVSKEEKQIIIPTQKEVKQKIVTYSSDSESDSSFYENYTFTTLSCSISNCTDKNLDIPLPLYIKYKKMKLIKEIYNEKISNSLNLVYVRIVSDFYEKFKKEKGSDDEEIISDDSPLSVFGPGK